MKKKMAFQAEVYVSNSGLTGIEKVRAKNHYEAGLNDGFAARDEMAEKEIAELKEQIEKLKLHIPTMSEESAEYRAHKWQESAHAEREQVNTFWKENQDLKASLKSAVDALGFYAPSNSYDYDKTQGANYIWNDQGKKSREVIKDLKSKHPDLFEEKK